MKPYYRSFLIIILLLLSYSACSQMILEYNTSLITGTTIQLPLFGTVDVTIDWGDGSSDIINSSGMVYHTYSHDSIYQIEISGELTVFGSEEWSINSLALINVISFGNIDLNSLFYAFNYAFNLQTVPEELPNTVTDLTGCFSDLTQDSIINIELWDVSNVILMEELFMGFGKFNQNISNWDVSNVLNMRRMFRHVDSINFDISGWDVSNVIDMEGLFYSVGHLNTDITNWDVSNVTDMAGMFYNVGNFNQDINNWDVSNVANMYRMFSSATSFNKDISSWDVSSVTVMGSMFRDATSFNQDVSNWDVSNVTNMSEMFNNACNFNQDLSSWDVSNVEDMSQMFTEAMSFNNNIGSWDVSHVTSMENMFWHTIFNQDIGTWDVSSVVNTAGMFGRNSYFNQDIGDWDVSSVLWMSHMFYKAQSFNQDISEWCVEQVPIEPSNFSYYSPLLDEYHPHWGEECFVGIINTEYDNTIVYPNPTISSITIDNCQRNIKEIRIYNQFNQVLYKSYEIDNKIDLSNIQSGIYIIELITTEKRIRKKIIKQ